MTFTSTVEKPSWRCGCTFEAANAANSLASPLALPKFDGGPGALACSLSTNSSGSGLKSRSLTQSPSSSSSTMRRNSSMPTLSIRNLMRARARLARRNSWRSKMRSTASEIFRYSPSSTVANSQKGAPTRGMIEVPPPVRISKPLTSWPSISRMRGTKPRSWMLVIARSSSVAVNATLNLRGSSWQTSLRTK